MFPVAETLYLVMQLMMLNDIMSLSASVQVFYLFKGTCHFLEVINN